ncbi:MAG: hypothetical protein ABIV42_06855 [Nitrosospira sp.]
MSRDKRHLAAIAFDPGHMNALPGACAGLLRVRLRLRQDAHTCR